MHLILSQQQVEAMNRIKFIYILNFSTGTMVGIPSYSYA